MPPPRFRVQLEDLAMIKNEIESQMRQKVVDLEQQWNNHLRMSQFEGSNNGLRMNYGPAAALPFTSSYPYDGMMDPRNQMTQGSNLRDSQMKFQQQSNDIMAQKILGQAVQSSINQVDKEITGIKQNGVPQSRFRQNFNQLDQSETIMKDVQKMPQFNDIQKDLEQEQPLTQLEKNIPAYEQQNFDEMQKMLGIAEQNENLSSDDYIQNAEKKFREGSQKLIEQQAKEDDTKNQDDEYQSNDDSEANFKEVALQKNGPISDIQTNFKEIASNDLQNHNAKSSFDNENKKKILNGPIISDETLQIKSKIPNGPITSQFKEVQVVSETLPNLPTLNSLGQLGTNEAPSQSLAKPSFKEIMTDKNSKGLPASISNSVGSLGRNEVPLPSLGKPSKKNQINDDILFG